MGCVIRDELSVSLIDGPTPLTAWKAFDQFAMSSAFLRDSSRLRFTGACSVIEPPGYMRETVGRRGRVLANYDHLPIAVKFEVRDDGQ